MKKKIRDKIAFFILCMTGFFILPMILTGCSDSEEETVDESQVAYQDLPQKAKDFLNKFYSTFEVVKITLDTESDVSVYQVDLENGNEVVFNMEGEWQQLVAPYMESIPGGIIPENMATYLETYYSGYGINEINRTGYGYNVTLIGGLRLRFGPEGDFIAVEDNIDESNNL